MNTKRNFKKRNNFLLGNKRLNVNQKVADARQHIRKSIGAQVTDARFNLVKRGVSDARKLLKSQSNFSSQIKVKIMNNFAENNGKKDDLIKNGNGLKNFTIVAKNTPKKLTNLPKFHVLNDDFKRRISTTAGQIDIDDDNEDYASNNILITRSQTIMNDEDIADNSTLMLNTSVISDNDFVSPLQGFRVSVTNLHKRVTQDDILELFGNIGPMKKARLIKDGTAEIVYMKRENALEAVSRYNMRELDDIPMKVTLTTKGRPFPKQKLSFFYKRSLTEIQDVDTSIVHNVLFGTVNKFTSKSVCFTVKLDVTENE